MTELHFSISDYSSSAGSSMLFWAISGCVIIGLAIVKDAVVFLRNRKAEFSCMSFRKKFNTLLRLFLPLAAMFVFFVSFTWPTFRYSRYLSSESIEDAVSTAGTIDRISAVLPLRSITSATIRQLILRASSRLTEKNTIFLRRTDCKVGSRFGSTICPKVIWCWIAFRMEIRMKCSQCLRSRLPSTKRQRRKRLRPLRCLRKIMLARLSL